MRKALIALLILGLSASPAQSQRVMKADPQPAPVPAPAPAPLPIPEVATLPELKLNIPPSIRLSRMVKFTLDPIVAPDHASYDVVEVSVDWVAVQRVSTADPLDDDLEVDRLDGTQAWMPTGSTPSVVSLHVTATLLLKDHKDGNLHQNKVKAHQDVQFGNPIVDPTVVVVDPVKPVPPPAPVVVDPTLTDGKFKLTTWTYKTLKDSRSQPAPIPITKAEAAAIGAGWHQVAQMARNNPQITMQQVVSNMAEVNRNNASKNLDNWIGVFFEPVRQKLNSVNRSVLSVADQAESYDEIGNGLEAWSKQP